MPLSSQETKIHHAKGATFLLSIPKTVVRGVSAIFLLGVRTGQNKINTSWAYTGFSFRKARAPKYVFDAPLTTSRTKTPPKLPKSEVSHSFRTIYCFFSEE